MLFRGQTSDGNRSNSFAKTAGGCNTCEKESRGVFNTHAKYNEQA